MADVDRACAAAWAVSDAYRKTRLEGRAGFLEAIGKETLALDDALIERAYAQFGFPCGRI